ncbi:hypothetical protein HWV62_26516 [Athelia sp. TMB]|nr:hypothetical protein HWV62_26516 [Athelia sp. TMB]
MPLDQTATVLFAVLISTLAYGVAVCLFTQSVVTIVRKQRLTGQNVLAIWVNFYWAILVYPEGPHAYLALIRDPRKTAIQTGQVGAIMLADLLIVSFPARLLPGVLMCIQSQVYRTFMLWGGSFYVIIIPCMTFLATFVAGVMFIHVEHIVPNASADIFEAAVTAWTISFLLCSFATTLYSTSLIAYKLWRADRNIGENGISSRPSAGHRVMIILIESAAVYSTMHLLYAILYLVKSNIEATPSFLEASVASITSSMIIIRCEGVLRAEAASPRSFDFGPQVHHWESTLASIESGGGAGKPENIVADELYVTKEVSQ